MGRKKYYSFWSDKDTSYDDGVEEVQSSTPSKRTYSPSYNRGYNALWSYSTPIYSSASVEKFRKVYKHIDDFKSILNIPENVKLLFKEGFTIRNNPYIFVKTEMFDEIKDYNEALDICLGGALIEFAKFHQGTSNVNIEEDLMSFDDYEDYVLSNYPGYAYFLNQFRTYKEERSDIFKSRGDKEYMQTLLDEILERKGIETVKLSPSKKAKELQKLAEDGTIPDLVKLVGKKSKDIKDATTEAMIEGTITKEGSIYTHHEMSEEEEYREALSCISPYISMVANSLGQFFINTKVRHYGSRNGTLDSNKLVEAIQGAPNVYYHEFERRSTQLDVCVVIDESGSMHGSPIRMAKQSAILLNEACKTLANCNLFIYGHTADLLECGSTNVSCYKDDKHNNPYALGSVKPKYENRDGEALREIAKKVRAQTDNTVLMFVLSDGAPSAENYRGIEAIEDTREAVKSIEKQNFIVTQCTFRGCYVPSSEMFTNYIEIDNKDESEFATKFTKYISGTLLKNYQITES